MKIGERELGTHLPPYIIAEVSCNHGGSIERAFELIDAAYSCGADAVKFQCYMADTITINCSRTEFTVQDGPWKGENLWRLYCDTMTPFDWFPRLKERADKVGITWFASVFDKTSVDLMVKLDAAALKIASFEITDTPLIQYAAATGKPLLISIGMASLQEAQAARWAAAAGKGSYIFLHCTSGYPAPMEDVELTAMHGVAGVSDHTVGPEIPIAATALGAAVIEKHFRLSWHPDTEDSPFSLDEVDFANMVMQVRNTWTAMQPSKKESEAGQRPLRRSLFAVKNIGLGERFTADNVRSIRPGHGLPPSMIGDIIGRTAAHDISRGEPLSLEMIER